MVASTIEFNADAAVQAIDKFRRMETATARALNRALTSGRAQMAKLLAQDMGLKSGDAKNALRAEQATPARLQVRMSASLKRLPLVKFGAKGPMPSRGKGRGVSYRIGAKGRGRVDDAFMAQMPSGHVGIYKRKGQGRLPIIELYGPSVGLVFERNRASVMASMIATFNDRLVHELRFANGGTTNAD